MSRGGVALACCAMIVATLPSALFGRSGQVTDWRRVATKADRQKLRNWRALFEAALQASRTAGYGAAIDREAALLLPNAALANPAVPQGLYSCRTIKLGARDARHRAYADYPSFTCQVSGSEPVQGFAKLNGTQRPVGKLYARNAYHQIFLGTLALGDEPRAMPYGRDQLRDMVGVVERIGERRWRIIFPSPGFESLTDVMEIAPQ